MEQVYKCEYCMFAFDKDKSMIEKHEKECGGNPKNKITDETLIRLSRIKGVVDDVITYILLTKLKDKRICFKDEVNRASKYNCPASLYEQAKHLNFLIDKSWKIQKRDLKWFLDITERDYSDFIKVFTNYLENLEVNNG